MKSLITLLLLLFAFGQGFPQSDLSETMKKRDNVFFGVSHNYLNTDMKLLSMTKHSVWDGRDLGTVEVSDEDIDAINAYMDYTERVHNFNLAAGMVLLNKPGSQWYADGRIVVGFNYRNHIMLNTSNDTAEVEIKSVHYSPLFGLGFNIEYLFNEKWGLNLGINSLYASGKVNKIDENIYPVVNFMDEDRNNKYRMSYSSANLMASYTMRQFTFRTGPGFYILFNKNEYHIVRSDTDDGSEYEDSITTTLRSDMFINAYLQIDWRINDHFMIIAGAGISKDISTNAAFVYFL